MRHRNRGPRVPVFYVPVSRATDKLSGCAGAGLTNEQAG
jgi:hypothetical protein